MSKDNVELDTKDVVNSNDSVVVDDSTKNDGKEKGDTDGVDNSDSKEVKDDNIMIPKHRFDEVNDKYKDIQKELQEIRESNKKAEKVVKEDTTETVEKETKEDDERYASLESKIKQFESVISDMVESRIKQIPEEFHDLIPEGLSNEDKISWIDKAEEKGVFNTQEKEENKEMVIGTAMTHSADMPESERQKKMNPIQLLASYYGK